MNVYPPPDMPGQNPYYPNTYTYNPYYPEVSQYPYSQNPQYAQYPGMYSPPAPPQYYYPPQ